MVNIFSLVLLGVGYFVSRFKIVDLETWKAAEEIIKEYAEMQEEAEANSNCGGGIGFQIYSEENENEE